jgi:hypothetical protein
MADFGDGVRKSKLTWTCGQGVTASGADGADDLPAIQDFGALKVASPSKLVFYLERPAAGEPEPAAGTSYDEAVRATCAGGAVTINLTGIGEYDRLATSSDINQDEDPAGTLRRQSTLGIKYSDTGQEAELKIPYLGVGRVYTAAIHLVVDDEYRMSKAARGAGDVSGGLFVQTSGALQPISSGTGRSDPAVLARIALETVTTFWLAQDERDSSSGWQRVDYDISQSTLKFYRPSAKPAGLH